MSTTATDTPQSPWMTAEEAAPYMRYNSGHAFRVAVRRYGIPHIRRGRKLFFTKDQLDRFMAIATEATTGRRRR